MSGARGTCLYDADEHECHEFWIGGKHSISKEKRQTKKQRATKRRDSHRHIFLYRNLLISTRFSPGCTHTHDDDHPNVKGSSFFFCRHSVIGCILRFPAASIETSASISVCIRRSERLLHH